MAEAGCLRDAHVQNLEVSGRAELAGTFTGYRRNVIALTNASTTARTLLASESGSLVTLDPSTDSATTITVTMPALEAGLEYTFALIADAGHTSADVILQTTANAVDFKGLLTQGNAANAEAASQTVLELAHSKITFDASVSTETGNTILTCVCNGSHWITTGNSTAVSGVTNPVLEETI